MSPASHKAHKPSPLTPANFVPGNPDRTYGSRPEKLNKSVRDRLGKLILPTTAQDILCPNFVVHVKGPEGKQKTAEIQAVYDGALAARGMEALWEFANPGENHAPIARTLTCTFSDGVLKMFAVARRSRSRDPGVGTSSMQRLHADADTSLTDVEYVTTRLGSWFVCDELDGFRRGAAAFRNGLEWARQQHEEAIERPNRRAVALGPSEDADYNFRAANCLLLSRCLPVVRCCSGSMDLVLGSYLHKCIAEHCQ